MRYSLISDLSDRLPPVKVEIIESKKQNNFLLENLAGIFGDIKWE
jgi:hypothetical protein